MRPRQRAVRFVGSPRLPLSLRYVCGVFAVLHLKGSVSVTLMRREVGIEILPPSTPWTWEEAVGPGQDFGKSDCKSACAHSARKFEKSACGVKFQSAGAKFDKSASSFQSLPSPVAHPGPAPRRSPRAVYVRCGAIACTL